MKRLLLLLTVPFYSLGAITPDIALPDEFSKDRFVNYFSKVSTSGHGGNSECNYVALKEFYPPGGNDKYPSLGPGFCFFSTDIIDMGYGAPDMLIPERVYLDKKSGLWKKKKYVLNKEESKESLVRYGINSLKELHPVELYNIQSVNAHGYAVIDSNIFPFERKQGIKKKLSFCLLYDGGINVFCGYDSMIRQVNGKETDFTPYLLKSLETVEMGLPEKKRN